MPLFSLWIALAVGQVPYGCGGTDLVTSADGLAGVAGKDEGGYICEVLEESGFCNIWAWLSFCCCRAD
jgi:hypothetical protein